MARIRGVQIRNHPHGVDNDQLNENSVDSRVLAEEAVASGNIADGAVINAKLAADAVEEDNILNGAVTTDKLDDNAVTPAKTDLEDDWDFSDGTVSVAGPTDAAHAANKGYVDATAQGLHTKAACRVATTAALPANTYDDVTKTLTADDDGALPSIDNRTLLVDDRVLVKNESAGADLKHGIYEVTALGDTNAKWVLTRAEDFDGLPDHDEVKGGAYTFIQEGDTNANSGWVLITNDPVEVGTTPLEFEQFSGAGQIEAGDGMTKVGNTLNVGAGDGIVVDTENVAVNPDTDGGTNLAPVINVSSDGVSVKVDETSVDADTNDRLKAAVPTKENKHITGFAYAQIGGTDYYETDIALAELAARGSFIRVFVNGLGASLASGEGEKATRDCYFADGASPAVAKAIEDIDAGDVLVWNKDAAGYDLAPAEDVVELDYAQL